MYTMEDIKRIKDEDREETVSKFLNICDKIETTFKHGLMSRETANKEICKLIAETGLHIALNDL